ncbi:hypothetical protein VTN00DRAFT_2744 [Thermoascus crustaceus]|uniref:uncharacterized protein n=1 Tax=Thermoascus crustaceus TaxID=5088 RepID=UPI003742A05E
MTVPLRSAFPDIQERWETGPIGNTSTAVTVDFRYSVTNFCVLIGELKPPQTINPLFWNNPNAIQTNKTRLGRELRMYAFHYKCPQVCCFDGKLSTIAFLFYLAILAFYEHAYFEYTRHPSGARLMTVLIILLGLLLGGIYCLEEMTLSPLNDNASQVGTWEHTSAYAPTPGNFGRECTPSIYTLSPDRIFGERSTPLSQS